MRPIALLSALAAVSAVALTAGTADAAPRKRHAHYQVQPHRARVATRIIIRKRSYLDPGTATLPYQQHFMDYAVTPTRDPFDTIDPSHSRRFPLPDAFDLPGFNPYAY